MADRIIVGSPLGSWQTNCFVVGDRDLGKAVVIDPGQGGADWVPPALDQHGLTCEAILVTHGHIDHFWAVPELARSLDVEVFSHADDAWLWENPMAGFGANKDNVRQIMMDRFGLDWDPDMSRMVTVADGQRLTFAGVDFDVEHNPGHTPGHVTFLGRGLGGSQVDFTIGQTPAAPDDVLFSGDLVFAGAIGRTDLAGGSMADMWRSLARTVLPLQDETLVLSGHGPETTVGHERVTNPYLVEAARVA